MSSGTLISRTCIIHTNYDPATVPPKPGDNWTRFVCVSDTHCQTFAVPHGDVLLHAGDLSNTGTLPELRRTADWLRSLSHATKIVIAGNHDVGLHQQGGWYDANWTDWHSHKENAAVLLELFKGEAAREAGIVYLQDEGYKFTTKPGGPRWSIWGSPWTPEFCDWAFNYERGLPAERLVNAIPLTDILLTHGPPHGLLDTLTSGESAGCAALRARLDYGQLRPRLHVFGHIHEARGALFRGQYAFVNAACAPAGEKARRRSWERPAFGVGDFAPVIVDLLDEA